MKKKEVLNEIIDWVKTIIFSIVCAFLILQFVRPTTVNGESMYPTLKDGDFLMINRNAYRFKDVEQGDIIVFKSNLEEDENNTNLLTKLLMGKNYQKKSLVKRVIGISGDNVKIHDKKVYVNDKEIKETYLNKDNTNNTEGDIDLVVPKDSVFVLGDNRTVSLDSRYNCVGFIKISDIVGKPFIRLYPFNEINFYN